tara:strand:+ start:1318 stop:1920 length:603 start_codon:yes stop_codon:yes gene_type:complete
MLQNQLSFNQSSVNLEIIGLPDFSSNDNNDQISIISQWKLKIFDYPQIEGDIDHLKSIMEAFYNYTNSLINEENAIYESRLIDIQSDNFFKHSVMLKSSKNDVKPLKVEIGNSELSDIINCFDQLNSSEKVKNINFNYFKNAPKNNITNLINKEKLLSLLLPPLISICSLFLFSSIYIYFYNIPEENENFSLINHKKINS